jgi:hypothetical protein
MAQATCDCIVDVLMLVVLLTSRAKANATSQWHVNAELRQQETAIATLHFGSNENLAVKSLYIDAAHGCRSQAHVSTLNGKRGCFVSVISDTAQLLLALIDGFD